MTAQATEQPTTPTEPTDEVDELRRYTPEEVAARGWLPFTARMIREKCYARKLQHHGDGGRITLTADDIRAYNAATARQVPAPRRKSA
ncbi:helix-turn-helix domain-containing protein [Actinacidiphila epipremni]|uniref:Helix-turn-helix domain-containing protein n=1 Tax=Actinacidiphila epipremni TaxID=2053013 RepID=A0ABX0ZKY5_9ACTN|nr:helix-turn-helix domain-containing protein [Actinacidiphila epipremni]NJP42308.1 helix-turn-helix domain-containing protein [Actinacidiphila epipremni]